LKGKKGKKGAADEEKKEEPKNLLDTKGKK